MQKKIYVPALAAMLLLLVASPAWSARVQGPNVKVRGGNIVVATGVALAPEQVEDIRRGVSKEIVFYVDLFRVWKLWPNEFILGRAFTQTLNCDPVKKEYVAASLAGDTIRERRFKSCDSLLRWALNISDFVLVGTAELEPSEYFVRVTVESRLRRLPPFIDLLFFFVKETEFSISGDSPFFPLKFEP